MHKIAKESEQVGTTAPLPHVEVLDELAAENQTSRAWHIRKAIAQYVERERPQLTLLDNLHPKRANG